MLVTVDTQELAAVLAGLRLLQRSLEQVDSLPCGIGDIYTDGGSGLTSPQIDLLCRRLNAGSG